MTLRNMREHGVHSLDIRCGALWCNHEAILDVSTYADDLTVPSFGPRMVCTICGAIGADARPNWKETAAGPFVWSATEQLTMALL
jgi:hypothetical protein